MSHVKPHRIPFNVLKICNEMKDRPNASKLRKIYVMVGCAMRTKMPAGRYLHGAHGAPYFDNTLNLLALGSE